MTKIPSICSVLLIVAAMISPATAATLISHYTFNGNSLNSVLGAPDAIRLGGGTSTYVTGFDGTAGGAVFFSGLDDDVLNATPAGLPNNASGFTSGSLAFWINAQQQGTANLMGVLNDGATTSFQIQARGPDSAPNSLLRFFIRDEQGDLSTHDEALAPLRWDDGLWHHVAMTWDASTGTQVTSWIYLDGALVDAPETDTPDVDTFVPNTYAMYIGGMNNRGVVHNDRLVNGAIDELRVYSGMLTAAEIKLLVSQPGDFDGDGDVDGADFVAWQTNFPKASGALLTEGDADGDGDVDGADFVVWQTNFPFTPGAGVTPVPEPSGVLVIAGLGLAIGLAAHRRNAA